MRQAVWAVVVARVGAGAKSRLSPVFSPLQRRELALEMLSNVLGACATLDGTVAVVDDPAAVALAQRRGAVALSDLGTDMNAAARLGLAEAQRRGATTAIVLPGDVPLVRSND